MSERERWVVYPLLFLALGVSLRDTMIRPITDEIRCRQLVVYDYQDRKIAELSPMEVTVNGTGEASYAGRLAVLDAFGLPVVSIDSEGLAVTGSVDVFGPINKPVVHIGSSERGGVVQVFHSQGNWNLMMGQWDDFFGLLSEALGGQYQEPLVTASDPLKSLTSEMLPEGMPPAPQENSPQE